MVLLRAISGLEHEINGINWWSYAKDDPSSLIWFRQTTRAHHNLFNQIISCARLGRQVGCWELDRLFWKLVSFSMSVVLFFWSDTHNYPIKFGGSPRTPILMISGYAKMLGITRSPPLPPFLQWRITVRLKHIYWRKIHHTKRYDKIHETAVRLEFHHMVKFQKDTCPVVHLYHNTSRWTAALHGKVWQQ